MNRVSDWCRVGLGEGVVYCGCLCEVTCIWLSGISVYNAPCSSISHCLDIVMTHCSLSVCIDWFKPCVCGICVQCDIHSHQEGKCSYKSCLWDTYTHKNSIDIEHRSHTILMLASTTFYGKYKWKIIYQNNAYTLPWMDTYAKSTIGLGWSIGQ